MISLKGVDLSNLIINLTEKHKLFSLDYLNHCIQNHNYGPMIKNKTLEPITIDMLKSKKIRSSASEMHTLFVNFSLIIGHKINPELDEWKLYMNLRQIIDIVTSKVISKHTHELLENLVEEHHELYLKCFTDTLKPKHRLLNHYARIMRITGPLIALSSMRFESFHKKFKNVSKSVTCRKHLLTTFAKKFEFQLCIGSKFLHPRKSLHSWAKLTNISMSASVNLFDQNTREYIETTL